MFWISAAVFISATGLYWMFGSAEIQPWNDLSKHEPTAVSDEEKQMTEIPAKELQTEEEDEENVRL